MSDDLVSLRMIVIAADQAALELWQRGAGASAVPVELTGHNAVSGIAKLARGGVDLCVLDDALPAAQKAAVIAAARSAQPAPLMFYSGPSGCERPSDIDVMLTRPATVSEARKLTEICVRAKIPTRVLIVDDSGTMRSIVRKILSVSPFSLDLHEAAEGFAALEQLRSGKFGLVFLDYNMPGLNGFETLSEIKRECPGVAVVIMTSAIDNAMADRAHTSGALAFLKKPFYPADINSVLERYYGLQ